METHKRLVKAGRYWRSVDPESFRRWCKEEGTKSLALAGNYMLQCDPDSFETAQETA